MNGRARFRFQWGDIAIGWCEAKDNIGKDVRKFAASDTIASGDGNRSVSERDSADARDL